jgi:exosortase A-associated hydrolase 2
MIEASSRRLFGVHYTPGSRSRTRNAILYVPPFAEEMNRSRRMAALQARALAALGWSTLLLDLFGTGDSSGDFRDARLAFWLDDITAAVDWLERQGNSPVHLWGLRLGALLACAAASARPDRFERLLLWQPVTDAKTILTQFLRVRVASAMGESGVAEKTHDLRARFARGQSVEVGGYELSAELAHALDDFRMDGLPLMRRADVGWFEVSTNAGDRLMPAGQRIVDAWRKSGTSVCARAVSGEPFWMLQETTLAPELLTATTEFFKACLERPTTFQ